MQDHLDAVLARARDRRGRVLAAAMGDFARRARRRPRARTALVLAAMLAGLLLCAGSRLCLLI